MTSASAPETLVTADEAPAHAPTPTWVQAVALPLGLVCVVLLADWLESPKTAYVGVLASMPFLSAVFGTPRQTAFVGVGTWLSALVFGLLASDGNAPAQTVRLMFIALAVGGAVLAARQRQRTQVQLLVAERERALIEQVRRDASTDLLTGLLNRRGLTATLEGLHRTRTWTLALCDCDSFKAVNDRLGHRGGDDYLQALAVRLSRALGDGDHVGRWGGDEFLIALPLSEADAMVVMRRVHEQVTREQVPTEAGSTDMRLTFGLAEWEPGEDFDTVLLDADRALYDGKAQGGSLVVSSGSSGD